MKQHAEALKLFGVLVLTACLSADIIYSCHSVQSSCRHDACLRGHANEVLADVLGRLGELETEVAEMRARRLVMAEIDD